MLNGETQGRLTTENFPDLFGHRQQSLDAALAEGLLADQPGSFEVLQRTGDDLRLRAFREAGIRPLRIPDEETVMHIEAAEIDWLALSAEQTEFKRTEAT